MRRLENELSMSVTNKKFYYSIAIRHLVQITLQVTCIKNVLALSKHVRQLETNFQYTVTNERSTHCYRCPSPGPDRTIGHLRLKRIG